TPCAIDAEWAGRGGGRAGCCAVRPAAAPGVDNAGEEPPAPPSHRRTIEPTDAEPLSPAAERCCSEPDWGDVTAVAAGDDVAAVVVAVLSFLSSFSLVFSLVFRFSFFSFFAFSFSCFL